MLDASDVADLLGDCFDFLATDEPCELVPAAGGDPIPFIHDLRSGELETEGNPARVQHELLVWVKEPLAVGSRYTYNGKTWTCGPSAHHKAGGRLAPLSYLLVREA